MVMSVLQKSEKQSFIVLDGGLATHLESYGANLRDPLWSAKLLIENPSLIKRVHMDYLEAGADIITTSSYQATFTGFKKRNIDREKAQELFELSVKLAVEARDEFWDKIKLQSPDRIRPLVAISVGPYGAYLANGAEYTGDYADLTEEELVNFHRDRLVALSKSGGDLFAFETIPLLKEAQAIIKLLCEFPAIQGWLSFSCKDDKSISHGELLEDCVKLANTSDQIVAVGINCTDPKLVSGLLKTVPKSGNKKALIVYPNSGERYTPATQSWSLEPGNVKFEDRVMEWKELGANVIGGCCRTNPQHIRYLFELSRS